MSRYATPAAFRAALEARLKDDAKRRKMPINRRRQLYVFERYVLRVQQLLPTSVWLKGGFALEARLGKARTTKDVDLGYRGSKDELFDSLQAAGRVPIEDLLSFEVTRDGRGIDGDGVRYEGERFRAQAFIAGERFGSVFGVDVGIADPMVRAPDVIEGTTILSFAEIARPAFRVLPIETHIAEKLHAYTLPRSRENSRLKDLPDLAYIAVDQEVAAATLLGAIKQTFEFRGTHVVPQAIPDPPASWTDQYPPFRDEHDLPWPDLAAVSAIVRRFLGPILSGDRIEKWNPQSLEWLTARTGT